MVFDAQRPGIPAVPGCLPARHLRQHEDGGADRPHRQGARVQRGASCRCVATTWSNRQHARRERDGRRGRSRTRSGSNRGRFFTPRLRFKTYDELNAWLLDQCVAYARRHPHPVFERQDFRGRCSIGRASVPGRLSRAVRRLPRSVPASVSKTCLVRFDSNKYSVAARAVGRDRSRSMPTPIASSSARTARSSPSMPGASAATRPSMTRSTTCPCWRGSPVRFVTARRSRTGRCPAPWVSVRVRRRRPRRRRQADGRDPHRRAGGWAGGGGGRTVPRRSLAACAAPTSCSTSSIVGGQPSETAPIPTPANLRLRFEPVADCTR